jgi:hypothetical protein
MNVTTVYRIRQSCLDEKGVFARHHSIQVTVDIYGHLVPGANRAAVNRLDEEPPQKVRGHGQSAGEDGRAQPRRPPNIWSRRRKPRATLLSRFSSTLCWTSGPERDTTGLASAGGAGPAFAGPIA